MKVYRSDQDPPLPRLNKELRGLFFLLMGLFLFWICPPRVRRNRILLFRPERMGDYMIFTTLLRALRKEYPRHEIRVVISTELRAIARTTPGVDGFFIRDRARRYEFRSRLRNLLEIRRWGAGTAIYPSQNRETWVDEMAIWSGSHTRLGLEGKTLITRSWILHLGQLSYNRFLRGRPRSEMENMDRVLEELGVRTRLEPRPHMEFSPANDARVLEMLREWNHHPSGKRWALMAPISRDTIRAWNREGFAQIIRQLHGQRGLATILVGAAEDAPELESIRDTCPDIPVHVCAGTLNFAELAAMARHSEVFIGVESGPLHIAMAAGIPSVCIMGGGLFGQFFPYGDRKRNRVAHKPLPCYGCQWKCIHETVRCLQEITTGRVWREVEIALEAR